MTPNHITDILEPTKKRTHKANMVFSLNTGE